MSAYSATILADSPTAYWRLNDTGTTAADATGNGHTGTLAGTITKSVVGATSDGDTAMTFDGTSGTISLTAINLGADVAMSIEGWVKRAANGVNHGILTCGSSSGYLRLNTSNKLEFLADQVASKGQSTGTITDTLYHHAVVTYAGAGGTVAFYIDGALSGSAAATGAGLAAPTAAGAISGGGISEFFNGRLDEVAIYPTALSAAKVLAHYQAAFAVAATASPPLVFVPRRLLPRARLQRPFLSGQRLAYPMASGPIANTKPLAAGLSFAGAGPRNAITKGLVAATLNFVGAQKRAITTGLAAGLSFVGAIRRAVAKGMGTATLTFVGSGPARAIAKGIVGGLSFVGAQSRAIVKGIAAGLTFVGTTVRKTTKGLAAAGLAFVGALTSGKAFHQALTAALSFVGSTATLKAFGKVLTATLTFSATGRKLVASVGLNAVLSTSGVVSRAIAKGMAGSLSLIGLLARVSSVTTNLFHRVTSLARATGTANLRPPTTLASVDEPITMASVDESLQTTDVASVTQIIKKVEGSP